MARRTSRTKFVAALVLALSLLPAARAAAGTPLVWPGGSAISLADGSDVFGKNLSGLAYQPSGSSAPGVLWAVRNRPSALFRLVYDGTKWKPDTANGWSAGKRLFYPDGTGAPDAEGVVIAGGDPNAVYVATEQNDNGSDVSRPGVLRYDVSSGGATLNATDDFNLTANLPDLDRNAGPEAIGWVPDDFLVAQGFLDQATAAAYNPATYANHGAGLFFVGVEQTGEIIVYALNGATDSFTRVATIASGFPGVMDLEYEPESTHLWAVCDDTCDGQHSTLDIAQAGPNDGKFVVTSTYARPPEMPNLNNEGFAIASLAECVDGLKPAFWSDDANTGAHALRAGTVHCGPPGPDTRVDGSVVAKGTQKQHGNSIAIKATTSCTEDVTAKATGKVKVGNDSFKLKPLTRDLSAGDSTALTLKPAKANDAGEIADALADGKTATAKFEIELTDAADNHVTESLSVKLKG